MDDELKAAVGAELTSCKILKTQPDVVQLVFEVPGTFKNAGMEIGKMVGCYGELVWMNPRHPDE